MNAIPDTSFDNTPPSFVCPTITSERFHVPSMTRQVARCLPNVIAPDQIVTPHVLVLTPGIPWLPVTSQIVEYDI